MNNHLDTIYVGWRPDGQPVPACSKSLFSLGVDLGLVGNQMCSGFCFFYLPSA